jgi:hypothetical protein
MGGRTRFLSPAHEAGLVCDVRDRCAGSRRGAGAATPVSLLRPRPAAAGGTRVRRGYGRAAAGQQMRQAVHEYARRYMFSGGRTRFLPPAHEAGLVCDVPDRCAGPPRRTAGRYSAEFAAPAAPPSDRPGPPHRTARHRTAPPGTAPHRPARHSTAPLRTAPRLPSPASLRIRRREPRIRGSAASRSASSGAVHASVARATPAPSASCCANTRARDRSP